MKEIDSSQQFLNSKNAILNAWEKNTFGLTSETS